jgi:AcrR family transcriptional regulator
MAHRAGLDTQRVVAAAAELVDAGGVDALTLAALAERLHVRIPSLYNHITGLDGLRRELALLAMRGLAEALGRATIGKSSDAALFALGNAYRGYATAHPGLYAMLQRVSPNADDELRTVSFAPVEVALAVLAGFGLEGDEAIHATRALRSALHGFVLLETAGGFALDVSVDESFVRLLAMLARGLRYLRPFLDR